VISNSNATYSLFIPANNRDASIPDYIDNATFEAIFLQERWDNPSGAELQYLIPVDNGNYLVNLYMVNSWSGTSQPGQRLFSIEIENSVVESSLDLSGTFGHQIGGMLQYPVTVTDGTLNIEFLHSSANNPLINAIEILGASSTTFDPIVVAPIGNQSNFEGDQVDLAVSANGGDPQANFLYAINGQPAGVSIEPTNGQIFGAINAGAANGGPNNNGIYNTSVTVSKPGSAPVTVNFTWTITGTNSGLFWTDQTDDNNYTGRHECSFVQAGDKFFLFGGRENTAVLDVYDYQSKTWSQGRANAPKELNHFQAVEYQGLIWVIAGFQDNAYPNETPTDFIWAYDPANDEWIQGPEIPANRRRGSTGVVVHNGKFYIAGGNTIGHNGGYVNWFDVYDPADGSWQILPNAPRPRDHFHAVIIDNKLYAAGGRLSGGPGGVFAPLVPEVDVFDFNTQSWSTLPSSLNIPTPRAAAASAELDGKLYVIGGEVSVDLQGNIVNDAFATTESFDPVTQQWSTEDDLIQKRHGTQAIASGDGIHIAAGSPSLGGGNTKKMEYFGQDNPFGSPSIAGQFGAPSNVDIENGTTENITLTNTVGNVGIFLRGFSITGPNASDFQIIAGDLDNGLIPANGSYVLMVNFTGAGSNSTAILEVAYGANSTAQITLNGSGGNGQDPPSITPVSTIEADAGDNIFQTVEVIDDGVPAVSIVIYDVSVYGTNNPFVPGGTVPTNAYSFTDGGNGLYELNWNTQNIDGGAYEARVTVNDGINPPVMEVFDINIAQDLLARLETNTFNNPDPWYGSSPQSPYTVSVASGPVGNIGWIDNGDFVEYLVDVPSAGTYDLLVWAAKGNNGVATVTFSEENGTGGFNAIGSVAVPKSPNPSPWNNYQGFTTQVSFTNAGVQTLRLDFNAAVNVDYLDFSTPQIFYTITAAAGPDGAISPNGTTSVLQGGSQSYSITPNPNYEIADVLVDGVSQGAISSYTFSNVNADATI
ncbi:MAG: malectin domain-containing carbohydrate-binding protein, partial [Bacteroidota bacterium]